MSKPMETALAVSWAMYFSKVRASYHLLELIQTVPIIKIAIAHSVLSDLFYRIIGVLR